MQRRFLSTCVEVTLSLLCSPLQKDDGVSVTAIREIMLLRELEHGNIVHLSSVHVNRAEPSLWLAFDYAEHDLYEMIRFHRENRENRRFNPFGVCVCLPLYVCVFAHVLFRCLCVDDHSRVILARYVGYANAPQHFFKMLHFRHSQ
jgi:serine/threonine protein kinase